MEAVMQQLVAGLQGQAQQDTPLGQAQALMYQAFEEPDEQKRIQLAKDALAISPDCADAYVLLAEHATSRKEALRLYEQGAAAGERALGAEAFQRDVGRFGAFSKPGRTCVPAWAWSTPSGPLAVVTRPCGICRTCSG
jgi:hypothetical protein